MKIESLRIDAFAGLKQLKLDFSGGADLYYGLNESGKSSVAAFIQVMLYGLGRNSRDPEKSLRKRYQPWSGGTFGGLLCFSYEGRSYRLERSFAEERRSDRCHLYDALTGREIQLKNTDAPAEELFHLSLGEYLNTAFVRALETDRQQAESLEEKINRMAGDGVEERSYQEVLRPLENYRKYLGQERKGHLEQLQQKLREKESQYQKALQDDKVRANLLSRSESFKAESEEIELELQKLEQEKILAEKHGAIERWNKILRLQDHLQPANGSEKGPFERVDLTVNLKDLGGLERLRKEAQQLRADFEAADRLRRSKIQEYEDFVEDARQKISREVAERERLEYIRSKQARRKPLKEPKISIFPLGVVGAFALLMIVLGLVLRVKVAWLAAFCFVLAALSPVVAMFYWQQMNQRRNKLWRQMIERRRQEEVNAAQLENEIQRLIWDLEHLEEQLRVAEQKIQTQDLAADREAQALSRAERDFQLALRPFFRQAPAVEDLDTAYFQLRDEALLKQGQDQQRAEQLARLQELMGDENRESIAAAAREAQDWIREHQAEIGTFPTFRPHEHDQRVQDLRRRLGLTRQEAAVADAELKHLTANTVETASLERELTALRERVAHVQKDLAALDLAIFLCSKARDRFEERYRPALNQKTAAYLAELSGERYDSVMIRRDLAMRLRAPEDENYHQESYFSSGTKDLLWLSLRLALIDVLSGQSERMPLVLDDSFSQLDETRRERVLKLLGRKAAEDGWQILYFSSDQALYDLAARNELWQVRKLHPEL